MDLGLNEFRLDLLDYVKKHDNLKKCCLDHAEQKER